MSSRLDRQLKIDMCNSMLKRRDNEMSRRRSRNSRKSFRVKPKPLKVESEPSIEFEWFCLDCEECAQPDCQHYHHPRCLINGDLHEHFDITGHSWAQPICNFVKTKNICCLEDLKHDPNYQDILRDQLK